MSSAYPVFCYNEFLFQISVNRCTQNEDIKHNLIFKRKLKTKNKNHKKDANNVWLQYQFNRSDIFIWTYFKCLKVYEICTNLALCWTMEYIPNVFLRVWNFRQNFFLFWVYERHRNFLGSQKEHRNFFGFNRVFISSNQQLNKCIIVTPFVVLRNIFEF